MFIFRCLLVTGGTMSTVRLLRNSILSMTTYTRQGFYRGTFLYFGSTMFSCIVLRNEQVCGCFSQINFKHVTLGFSQILQQRFGNLEMGCVYQISTPKVRTSRIVQGVVDWWYTNQSGAPQHLGAQGGLYFKYLKLDYSFRRVKYSFSYIIVIFLSPFCIICYYLIT